MCKTCEIIACKKRPCFGQPGDTAKRCGGHRIEGDIDVVSKKCEKPGCLKQASFGQTGGSPQRCAGHKISGDINVKGKTCEIPGCPKGPKFGRPGGSPQRCGGHRIGGDINVKCTTCADPGCPKIPAFGQPGEPPRRCAGHRIEGDINVKNKICESPGCPKVPSFGQPGGPPRRCAGHRIEGDVNVINKTCESPECPILPSFGHPGESPQRCFQHKSGGDVNVSFKRCSICVWITLYDRGFATYFNPQSGIVDMCYNCHVKLHPSMHTKLTVRKEQFILAEIQRQIPDLEPYFITWDCKLPGQNCTNKKPDMAWGIKDTLIHVEVDEDGEDHEDNTERIVAIHAASNLSNHVLIRFNPDTSSSGEKPCLKRTKLRNGDRAYSKDLSEWNRRIPVLVETIKEAFDQSIENVNVVTKIIKLFF